VLTSSVDDSLFGPEPSHSTPGGIATRSTWGAALTILVAMSRARPDHVATSVFIGRLEKRLAGVCLLLQNAYSYSSARQRHRAGQSGESCSDNDAVVIHPLRGGGKRCFAKSDGSLPPLFAPRSA